MRVARLERFSEPSRRCDPRRVNPEDELLLWDLPGLRNRPLGLLGAAPRAVADWLTCRIPRAERRRLLRACLRTGGARLGALACGPSLWRRAREGEVGRIMCFSAKDFALADLLGGMLEHGRHEVISDGTQYFGEFAFELLAVVPYAYWLHRQGRLKFTVSTEDTRCLYYFSGNHEERPVRRRYVPITEYPIGERGTVRFDRKGFPRRLDSRRWHPPPYKEVYRDDRFGFSREVCVVCNKTSDERYLRRGFSVNAMDNDLVMVVIGMLRSRYQVVYSRPRASDIVNDHQAVREMGDIEAVQVAYPDVLTIQQLHARNADLSFNELQLRLFANCERFVTVLGGAAYLASYFGGINVVYARRGWEVSCAAFENWFDRFSGTRVVAARTPGDLVSEVERELLRAA
jgi:hypothetical protein